MKHRGTLSLIMIVIIIIIIIIIIMRTQYAAHILIIVDILNYFNFRFNHHANRILVDFVPKAT